MLAVFLLIVLALIFCYVVYRLSRNFEEKGQLTLLFSCLIAFTIITVFLTCLHFTVSYPLTADYSASINVGNKIYVNESYVYHLNTYYHALYRRFKTPLFIPGYTYGVKTPHVTLKGIESRYWEYAVDAFGRIALWNVPAYYTYPLRNLIASHARPNEAGIVSLNEFKPGNYRVNYSLVLYPPVQTDGIYYHVNLKLAGKHVPYNHVRIRVTGVQKLFVHFPGSKVVKTSYGWLITGKSPENGLIELEMLLKKPVSGYVERVNDVYGRTVEANRIYSMQIFAYKLLKAIFVLVGVAFPGVIYLIYRRYGREIEVTVPEYLSYVPNRDRKPWVVNLAFKGDAFTFDEDGFFATLLNLERLGLIRIKHYEKDRRKELKIEITGKETTLEDEYEKEVFRFLKKYARDGVFDTYELKKKPNLAMAAKLRELMKLEGKLAILKGRVEAEFIDTRGRDVIYALAMFSLVFLIVGVFAYFYFGWLSPDRTFLTFGIECVAESVMCLLTPVQLFGRWKGGEYEERLQWHAFARFLSNMAMIKKYEPEDINMWKEWLVYGTALGVGKKVAAIMKALNVEIPEYAEFYDRFLAFYVFYYLSTPVYITSTAVGDFGGLGGFGGGFGGGGFGGGGAGGW